MPGRGGNFFRNLWSDNRRTPCRWIGCSTANYICNHEKKTAAGRGCPSSRRGPSASTSSHGSSSPSYSLSSISRTGPRTCFGRKNRTSERRRGSARIKERGSRPFPSYPSHRQQPCNNHHHHHRRQRQTSSSFSPTSSPSSTPSTTTTATTTTPPLSPASTPPTLSTPTQ